MVSRLHLEDWRIICHYLGALILLMAAVMCLPFALALALGELDQAVIFLKCIGITGIVGALLTLAQIKRGTMMRNQALVVTALSWAVLAFFGTLPLWFSGHYASFLDALLEGVSGITATGLSIAVDLDHMALSMVTWRFILHLMGGVGVLVIALALGIFGTGAGAASIYTAEAREGRVMPEIRQMSRFIFKVTAIIIAVGTVACSIPLLFGGQAPLRAAFSSLWITISAFATGGMTGQSMGIMAYHSWPLEIISVCLMFFGIINFTLYGDIWKGRVKRLLKDIEVHTMAIWILGLVLVLTIVVMSGDYFNSFTALLRRVVFLVISAATNVGFSTVYSGQLIYAMGSGALFMIGVGMIIGGSSSSTTGGIKAFRIGICAKTVVQTLREALVPDRVMPRTFYYHMGRKVLTADLASSAMTIFLMYILTFAVGAVAGIICGYDALPAIFESISAASNGGLSAGIVSPGMPVFLEVVYIVEMLLGRLEFIAVFAMVLQVVHSLEPKAGWWWERRRS